MPAETGWVLDRHLAGLARAPSPYPETAGKLAL